MDINTNTDSTPQLSEQNIKEKIFNILNLSVPILMGIFIFLNPFPHTTAIKEICFYLSVIIILLLICFKKINFSFKSPITLPFALFVLWATLSILWALNMQNTIHDVYAHLIKHVMVYFILINFFNSKKLLITLSWIIIISAFLFSTGGLFYYYVTLGNPLNTRFAVCLFSELPINFIGTITVFAIILCLNNLFESINSFHRATLFFCLLPLFASTLLTQTRGTAIALILSVTAQLFYKSKKAAVLFIMVMVIVVTVTPIKHRINLSGFKQRIFINYITYEITKNYPIAGIGFGMQTFIKDIDKNTYVRKVKTRFTSQNIHSTHNLLLSVMVRLGIVGLLLFLSLIFIFSKMCWQTIKYGKDNFIRKWGQCLGTSFLAFFIIGLSEPVFLFYTSAAIFYIIFAMLTILWHLNKEVSPHSAVV